MALIQETVENWGLRKCGEISTLLSVGKEEFFLSCEFCDYTVLQLDKFIRHMCESHQPEFTEIKTETNLAKLTAQLQDEEVGSQWENSDEENDDKDYALRGFERVEIELDPMEMEDSLDMKEEDISEVFVKDKHSLYIETSDAEMSDVSCYDNKQVGADESGMWVEANKLHVPSNGRSELIDTSSCMLQDDKDSAAEKEFNIELIKLYRSLPLLWDTKHKDHNNRILRTRQYDILLAKYKEMYPDAVRRDLLKKINYLQSNYRRELRRVSSHETSTLYYFDAMDFLRNDEQSSWESQSGVSDLAKLKPTSQAVEHYAKPEKVTETVSKSNSSYIQQNDFRRKETGFPQSSKEEQDLQKLTDEQKFILELIELYRSLPALWNIHCTEYNDRESKNIQYQILLEKYKERYPHADKEEVKRKINTLRTNFRRTLKTPYSQKLYYFDAMRFLCIIGESQSTTWDFDDMQPTSEAAERYAKPEKVTETVSKSNSSYIQQNDFRRKETGFPQSSKEEQDLQKLTDEQKFILELIELYRSLPALWNINCTDYNDRESKNIQYQILLEKYKERYPHADKEEVKKKINTLRTSFRRTLKTPNSPKLYYFDAMRFLCIIDESKSTTWDFDDMQEEDNAWQSEEINKSDSDSEITHNEYDIDVRKDREDRTSQTDEESEQNNKLTSEKEFVIELIKLYHKLPALWHINSKAYQNRLLKSKQYETLLAKYREKYRDATMCDLKRRISNLRSNFHRESKRISLTGETNLYYYDEMRFLLSNYPHSDGQNQTDDLEETQLSFEQAQGISKLEEIVSSDNEDDDFEYMSTDTLPQTQKGNKGTNEKDFILELIEVYRSLPALWNKKYKDYHNRQVKSQQYKKLLQKYKEGNPDADVKDLKRKINCLRCNYQRESKRNPRYGVSTLYYFDAMSFLRSNEPSADSQNMMNELEATKAGSGLDSGKFARSKSLLNDAQFIALANIYKAHPCLWDENVLAYRFANRRREALANILEELNKETELNLTKCELEKEISLLRKICSTEKRQKIFSRRNKSVYEAKYPYYEQISFVEIDVTPFECSICGNLFAGLSQYKVHLASHDGSLPFKCNVCGHGFQLASNLAVHLRRHAQDYTYSCAVCNKQCVTSTELKTHMLHHTGEKPYVCDICGKSFRWLREFQEHINRHENRPRYKCEICSKAFYKNGKLKEHMAVHFKVRDKICKVCNKAFTTQKQLRQHQHIHNAEKKFICKICGKSFAQPAGLSGHKKSHCITTFTKNPDLN
ncbi:uncharacterized protein LOC129237442 isoform X2 [Anastrepha obliqua]|uniref:uncharacterized protein LOC129237442 isoform X2 n=1 Tax=Anastrepha obliqua TaxID=95512 RepID=UPI002408F32A|nr:uncharacterized protein LOC129237442 isoform X2 [Anastrepha obliqua]